MRLTFELHAQFATHVRFLGAAEPLLTRLVQGLRFAADRGRRGGGGGWRAVDANAADSALGGNLGRSCRAWRRINAVAVLRAGAVVIPR